MQILIKKKRKWMPDLFVERATINNGLVIRYGTTKQRTIEAINTAEAIELAADKIRMKQKLLDEGIPTPKFTEDLPAIGRPRMHSAGRKYFLCKTPYEKRRAIRRGAEDFSEPIEKIVEYRVHMVNTKNITGALLVQEKSKPENAGPFDAWNHTKGGVFHVMKRSDVDRAIVNMAMRGIKSAGLATGAVDIMVDKNENIYIIEINTAPKLEGYTLNKYMELFSILEKDKKLKTSKRGFICLDQ